jgi:hypothetical protein
MASILIASANVIFLLGNKFSVQIPFLIYGRKQTRDTGFVINGARSNPDDKFFRVCRDLFVCTANVPTRKQRFE